MLSCDQQSRYSLDATWWWVFHEGHETLDNEAKPSSPEVQESH
jgi:hypothetical protein